MRSLLKEYIKLLTELRVVGEASGEDYDIFVYKDKIFIYGEEEDPYDANLPEAMDEYFDEDELEQIRNDLSHEEIHTDWLKARVSGPVLYIQTIGNFQHNPETSLLVKKVVRQLGLRKAVTSTSDNEGADVENEYFRNEIRAEIPSMGYHGTSSNSLFDSGGIMRVGLRPGGQVGKSNFRNKYQDITHHDVLSLDFNKETVKYYADLSAKNNGGFKVILGVTIPDKSKVVADFDIDSHTGRTTFGDMHTKKVYRDEQRTGRGPLKTSIDVGRIGYEGRIPPSYITRFWYWSEMNNSWEEASLDEIRGMWEMAQDYGDEAYEMSREEYEEDMVAE